MKNKNFILLLIAALCFAACKKEPGSSPEGGGPLEQEKGTAKLTLKIKQASGLITYAGADPNATLEEISVTRVDVFIFDNAAPYGLTHRFFDNAATIYNNPADPEAGLKDLELDGVKTGVKRIYVGLNLTSAVVDRLIQNYAYLTDGITFNAGTLAPFNADQLMEHLVFPAAIGSGNDARLVMFNTYDFNHLTNNNVVEIIDGVNPVISLNVSRMVAKAAVKLNAVSVLSIPGGTLSNLRFTAGQTNNRLHLAPLRDYVDANWESFESTDFNPNAVDVGFQPWANGVVSGATTTWGDFEDAATPKIYIPENTSKNHRHNEVSYISLRAVFTPYDDGEPLGFGTTPTVTGVFPAGDFWAVFSNDPSSSGSPVPGVAVHFFPIEDDADDYIAEHGGDKLFYEDGFCYYRIYLNPGGTTGNKYDVLRNVFYKVNITKINTIGTTLPDHIPGQLGTPGFPGTVDTELTAAVQPTDQINPPVNADIVTAITIEDWADESGDYEF